MGVLEHENKYIIIVLYMYMSEMWNYTSLYLKFLQMVEFLLERGEIKIQKGNLVVSRGTELLWRDSKHTL